MEVDFERGFFIGVVEPTILELSIEYRPEYLRSGAQESPDALVKIEVKNGRLRVEVRSAKFDLETAGELLIPCLDDAQALVDAAGFIEGVPYRAVINEIHYPDGSLCPVILSSRELPEHSHLRERDIENLADLALNDIQVKGMVRDAMMMVGTTNYAPTSCGRIVDGMVRHMTGGSKGEHWAKLHAALNVDRDYVKLLTDQSKAARHGHREYVDAPTVATLAARTYVLVSRYVAYLLRGKSPLPESDFPMLRG